jgi:hypothetical protein
MDHIRLQLFDTASNFCSDCQIRSHAFLSTVSEQHVNIQPDTSKPYDLLFDKGA